MQNFASNSFPLLLLILLSSLACSKPESDVKPDNLGTIEKNLKIELNATLHPLSTTDPNLPVNDLAFLGNLGNAKIVGMGEATHGTQEFFQMKHRIFKYLVEKQGFRYLAFEYDLGGCMALNELIQSGQGDIKAWMSQQMYFWTWRTTEVLELFLWMQDYNRNKPDSEKVHLVGVDCQFPKQAVPQLVNLLKPYDNSFATEVSSKLNSIVKHELYKGETFATLQQARNGVLPQINAVGRALNERAASISQLTSPAYYQQIMRVYETIVQAEILQYNQVFNAETFFTFRERYMAENLDWVFSQYGNVKVALWAHNEHVAKNEQFLNFNTNSLGGNLKAKYGSAYQVIGFSMGSGNFKAYNALNNQLETMRLAAPITNSLNYPFTQADEPHYGVILADLQKRTFWNGRLSSSRPFLSIGAVFNANLVDHYYYTIRLDQLYDVIFHFDNTNPSRLF
ncbi:MAG: erythromycin esterase family protein [Haliscomenobacter sp.]|uniref:erythromycin esterase family protein n=1 Tax=Haliscomenobacter sp. TaxID=2717303 RepID=UPI0029B5DFDF|nr:erythromycin esterase family protein [Haliscomenobacter sp.]MDX2068428.1 erythromycin esterase family protein [Haliscomenobacter sp.]